jgi:2'-5' RNA ligase
MNKKVYKKEKITMYNFSIISYLDPVLTKKVRKIQKDIFDITGSKACLEMWEPHITVGPGINIKDKGLADFCKSIERIALLHSLFKVQIKNYGFMDNWAGGNLPGHTKYVIYLDVIINEELLRLADDIKELTEKNPGVYYKPWPYAPHLTLAYKDLTKEGFMKIKSLLEYKKLNTKTVIDHFALAKQDTNGQWKTFKKFKLKPHIKAIEEKRPTK